MYINVKEFKNVRCNDETKFGRLMDVNNGIVNLVNCTFDNIGMTNNYDGDGKGGVMNLNNVTVLMKYCLFNRCYAKSIYFYLFI
jgi:hypothetical protein